MPILKENDGGGYFNIDDDKISIKTIPLNIVLFNIKQSIRMIRPNVNQNKEDSNQQFIELIELFEEEIHPYIDEIYAEDLKKANEKLANRLLKNGYTEEEIIDDTDKKINVERCKIKYRLLNSLLCRKNIYPSRTFTDTIDLI